jgi:hypothetical protein
MHQLMQRLRQFPFRKKKNASFVALGERLAGE